MALGVSTARSSLPPYTSVPDLCLQSSGVELFPSLPLAALHSLEYWTLDVDTLGVVCFVATVLLIVYISCCPLSNFRLQGLPTPKLNSSVSLRGSPSPKPVSIARQSQRSKQSTSSPSRSGQTSTKEPSRHCLEQTQIDPRFGMGLLGSRSGDSIPWTYGRDLHQLTPYCRGHRDSIAA
ncbi:unnamed protein product [Brassica oleracea]